jgi:hypothetical protein
MNGSCYRADQIHDRKRPSEGRHFSYGLRSILIVIGCVCVVLAYLVRPYHLEERAEARLRTLAGGYMKGFPVAISYCQPSGKGGDYELLKAVRLSHSSVTDSDLSLLRDIRHIGILHLSNTTISDKGLQIVGGLNELRHLSLDHTRISDAGIVRLRQLTQLRSLCLNGTPVSDQIVDELRLLPRLKAVELSGSNFTANGRVALQAAIPDCVIIH